MFHNCAAFVRFRDKRLYVPYREKRTSGRGWVGAWPTGSYSHLLQDLLAYWKLDELTGTRVDSHGTHNLPERTAGTVAYAVAKLGNGANFDGTAGVGLTESSANTYDWTNGITVTGWIKLNNVTSRSWIHVLSVTNTQKIYLVHYGQNSWRFDVADTVSGSSLAINTTASALDTWFFMVGRYNPTNKKAYLRVNDGADAVAADALSNGAVSANLKNNIGTFVGAYSSNALIDSVGLWNRYLSDTEITSLYNGGDGLEYPFLGEAAIEDTEWYAGPDWYVEA